MSSNRTVKLKLNYSQGDYDETKSVLASIGYNVLRMTFDDNRVRFVTFDVKPGMDKVTEWVIRGLVNNFYVDAAWYTCDCHGDWYEFRWGDRC